MSLGTIVELMALLVVLAVGGAAVYVVFEMREVYSDQRDKFLRAISAVEELRRNQPELLSAVKLMQSDAHSLQQVAVEIERTIAELKTSLSSAVISAAERQTTIIGEMRDHIDWQESKLLQACESIGSDIQSLVEMRTRPPHRPNDNAEYVRLGRDILEQDAHLRFSLLKDWVALNFLAIRHRAARPWKAPYQLISGIPDYLQAEVELAEERVLLIGTRGHTESLAVPIGNFDSNTQFKRWFDDVNGLGTGEPQRDLPAIVDRAGDMFRLVEKGRIHTISEPQFAGGNSKI